MESPTSKRFTGTTTRPFLINATLECVDGKIVAVTPFLDYTVLEQTFGDQTVLMIQSASQT